jgi:hypothetical protein
LFFARIFQQKATKSLFPSFPSVKNFVRLVAASLLWELRRDLRRDLLEMALRLGVSEMAVRKLLGRRWSSIAAAGARNSFG